VRLNLLSRTAAVVADAVQESLRSRSIPAVTNEENEKPLRASALIYNLTGGTTTTEWINVERVTQRRLPGLSPSSNRRSPPRGLGYVSLIQ
jgi:hypothetical protein